MDPVKPVIGFIIYVYLIYVHTALLNVAKGIKNEFCPGLKIDSILCKP